MVHRIVSRAPRVADYTFQNPTFTSSLLSSPILLLSSLISCPCSELSATQNHLISMKTTFYLLALLCTSLCLELSFQSYLQKVGSKKFFFLKAENPSLTNAQRKGNVICSSDVPRGAGANLLTKERIHYELIRPAALHIPTVA